MARANHAIVLCLGDLGRSPRMQYHALSLAEAGCTVTLVGYTGEVLCDAVQGQVREVRFAPPNLRLPLMLKAIWLLLQLVWVLWFRCERAQLILVQTPPAIPTLLACFLGRRGATLVADWHNLGFSLIEDKAKRSGRSTKLASIYRVLERLSAKLPSSHLCVTEVMATWLGAHFAITAHPAPDRPPSFFMPSVSRSQLRHELGLVGQDPLVVSSTSWTPDEDFSILLRALELCQDLKLRVIITGKGELRQQFERQLSRLQPSIDARCVWLSSSDYAKLLAAADVGISLHASTSKLDLPMKVVDMLGANLPVLALDYPAIPELVRHGHNGLLFQDAQSLAECLHLALGPTYSRGSEFAAKLRQHARFEQRWHDMWRSHVKPLLQPHLTCMR